MISFTWRLLTLFFFLYPEANAQKLKKADRAIVANVKAHTTFLSTGDAKTRTAGSSGEKAAGDYISKQFARSGLKPMGNGNSWFQHFEIYDGKTILPATSLIINGKSLSLFTEYFPFAFSANKKTDAAVAIALAENGVPWFKELREMLEGYEDSATIDTMALIRHKARVAADKGATALIVYSAVDKELTFDSHDRSPAAPIPVVYITQAGFKKYCSDESSILDIEMNVSLKEKIRTGTNVVGYADNNADSILIATAQLERVTDVAALMEVARLLKGGKSKNRKNFLFIAYCGEQAGAKGSSYFRSHPVVNLQKVDHTVNLDTVSIGNENPKELHLVKRSLEIIGGN